MQDVCNMNGKVSIFVLQIWQFIILREKQTMYYPHVFLSVYS